MFKKLVSAGAVALAATAGVAQAAPVSAWENTEVSGFRNDSYAFGDVFTVGATGITVTSLGALDVGLDGFVTQGGIQVGLFQESNGALLASSRVLSSDSLVGNYRFSDIIDVTLAANTQYRVVAVNEDDLYNITEGSSPSAVDARISWNRYGYCQTVTLTRCDAAQGTSLNFMANFQLDNGTQVPEPGSMLLVAAAGLCLLVSSRRSKQA